MLVILPEGQIRSGKIGSTVWAHNRYGVYARTKATPVNPNSPSQQSVRAHFQALSAAWYEELDNTERQSWKDYADQIAWLNRVGQDVRLAASVMFVASNMPRRLIGLALVKEGPTTFVRPSLGIFTATASEATQKISVAFDNTDEWAGDGVGHLVVYQGQTVGPSVNFFNRGFAYLGKVDGDDPAPASPVALDAVHPFLETQRIQLRARALLNDGRVSPPYFFRVDAAA